MKIIRVKHDAHFTVIRNKTLRDSRLSFKATGLLAYLLTLPDDAVVSRYELATVKTDGEKAVRGALVELAKAGYIKHEKVQDEHGRWRTETTVRECPKPPSPEDQKRPTVRRRPVAENRPLIRSNKEGATPSAPVAPPFVDVSLLDPLTPAERDHGKRRAEQLRQRLAQAPAS